MRIGRQLMPGMKRTRMRGFMQSGDFPVPVLYLKFGKNTGNALKDSSPEGNDATNYGATWVKGYLGPALSIDGLDDYIVIDDDSTLRIIGDLTIMAWIKPLTFAKWGYVIVSKHHWYEYEFYLHSAGTRLLGYHGDGSAVAWANSDAFASIIGSFHHVAVVRDATALTLAYYLDGVSIGGGAYTTDIGASTRDINIGARANTNYYKGIADEVLIFDEALNAAQIRQSYYGIM